MDYPQRWLKEAQAITSPEGWRKEKTNELLKCHRGLDELYEEKPEIKTVNIEDYPEMFLLDDDGNGQYIVNFSYTDDLYIPKLIKVNTEKTGTATVTINVLPESKSVEVNITNGSTDDTVSISVDIDSVVSTKAVTKLTKPAILLTSVETINVPLNVNLDKDGNGSYTFNYKFTDPRYVPELVTVDLRSNDNVKSSDTVDQVTKTVTIDITNGSHNDILNLNLDIDGVKSTQSTTNFNVPPKLTNVLLGTVPANLTLDVNGNGTNNISYTYEETRYTPKVVTCKVTKTGSVTVVETVEKDSNKVSFVYTGGKTGDTISYVVNIDGVDSDPKTSTIKVPASIKTVTIGDVPATVEVDGLGEGNFEFGYTYIDADYATISVKCNTTSTTAKVTASPDVPNKKIKVSLEDAENDEELTFEVEIDGVKSAIKKTTVVRAS